MATRRRTRTQTQDAQTQDAQTPDAQTPDAQTPDAQTPNNAPETAITAPNDDTLLSTPVDADSAAEAALDRATAKGIIEQAVAYLQTGERLVSQALHAGIYDAIYRDSVDILQDLLDATHGKVDAARGIIRAIHIMTGAIRREPQTGAWYYAEERGIIAIDKQGRVSYRDRYRDALGRIRENYCLRFFGRNLKTINGLIKDDKPLLTARGIRAHIAKVQKAEFAAEDRAYIKAYLQAFVNFEENWNRTHAEPGERASLPTSNSRHNGKPVESITL